MRVDEDKGLVIADENGVPPQISITGVSEEEEDSPPGFATQQNNLILVDTNRLGDTTGSLFNIGIQTQKIKKTVKVRRRLAGKKLCS